MKVMVAGQMGRDDALARRLLQHEGCQLYPIAEYDNPGLMAKAAASGGEFYRTKSITDRAVVAKLAVKANIDLFLTNSDDALAAGVVDAVREQLSKVLIPSPTQEEARIESDKFDAREIVAEIDKRYNPDFVEAKTPKQVASAIEHFKELKKDIAIKPRGLSGGRGVKVMGKHFKTYLQAQNYALRILKDPKQNGVVIEEKLEGYEFNIQALTDGKILVVPPATYDYPYREDGDVGPGTGGMGCFTMSDGLLPFINQSVYDEAIELMRKVQSKLRERGRALKGTMYGSFFMTKAGLKLVEFNGRLGDPEGINVMELLEDDVNILEVLEQIAHGELDERSIRFKKAASAVIYLVTPQYAHKKASPTYEFGLDLRAIEASDCRVYFAAAERVGGDRYKNVGNSRTFGVTALADTPPEARQKIQEALKAGFRGQLEYRHDIADRAYIRSLATL